MQTHQSYIKAVAPHRSHREWADMLGTSRSYFCEIVSGAKKPGPKLIRAINQMTDGQVPPAVWFMDAAPISNTNKSAPDTGAGQPVQMAVNKPGVNYDQP